MKSIRAVLICLACTLTVFWFSGCVQIQPTISGVKPESAAPENYLTHTVGRHGENLITISRWYTGSGENWQHILEANPSIDPRRIRVGDTVLIPEKLLKTWEPMPAYYPENSADKEIESPPPEPIPPLAEIELFGPIDTPAPPENPEASSSALPLETIE